MSDEKKEEPGTEEAVEDAAEEMEEIEVPLAVGLNGEPIDIPDEAVGWRVSWRKLGERGGSPSVVFAQGRPLILPLDATADDLIERIEGRPGRYRLDPVTEDGRLIPDAAPAYSIIQHQIAPQKAATETKPATLDDLVRHLVTSNQEAIAANQAAMKTLQECFTTQTQQVANMIQACGNLVNPNRPVEYHQTTVAPPAPPAAPARTAVTCGSTRSAWRRSRCSERRS